MSFKEKYIFLHNVLHMGVILSAYYAIRYNMEVHE